MSGAEARLRDRIGGGRALALIDGNSFYCSCERVFDPKLARLPVIVLSNHDGCAIARTAEAKALGIKMGAPYFMIRQLCEAQGVRVLSSNYTLYGDMSAHINAIYRDAMPDVEVYSIDESFLDLTGFTRRDRVALARDIRATVRAWTGIPTCVGIGPTKTLAKLANHIAKTVPILDHDLRLLKRVEDLAVQKLISQASVEALDVAVLPRRAGSDVGCLGADAGDPGLHRLGDELWSVVRADVAGHTAQDEQVGQHVDDVRRLELACDADRQALARELVDHVEHPEPAPVMGARFDKVVGPDVIAVLRPQSQARAVPILMRPRLGCLAGTFRPSRRQIRSTRLSLTSQPAAFSNALILR